MRSPTGHMQRSTALCVAACTVVAASAVLRAAPTGELGARPGPHFFSRVEQPLHEYRAFRYMHAYCENQKHEAWMQAWTELKDGQFSYRVVSESGSEAIRGRVLRALLEREQEFVKKGDANRGDLTAENYEFSEGGRDEEGAHVVQIKPRRS